MIFSENPNPPKSEFQKLIHNMDDLLNKDALSREDYYVTRNGRLLEEDVYSAVCQCARGTEFENTIYLVSGASFPDIVINKFYGLEVKSTGKNHWTSIGSSILESTRNESVERIYLTFGKLGRPVKFLSRPYEECLSGIAVTHYPRYQIDMRLRRGETIFDKIGIPYDSLRLMENPIAPVSKYYKSKLKNGESLWWTANENESVPPTVKLWTALSASEKESLVIQGYAFFPELFSDSSKKYNRYALWLVVRNGVVNTNIRDGFSAGGKINLTVNEETSTVSATLGRVCKYKDEIKKVINSTDEEVLEEHWGEQISADRIKQWCRLVVGQFKNTWEYEQVKKFLNQYFN